MGSVINHGLTFRVAQHILKRLEDDIDTESGIFVGTGKSIAFVDNFRA
jgi:hypothetical protein